VTPEENFIQFSANKLEQLHGRIQDCLARLTPEQLWTRNSENENAPANLVLHLCGNLRQWILSGVAGQPDHRNRDSEFDARGGVPPAELADRLKTTVTEVCGVIRNLPPTRLSERTKTQNYDVTVLENIYHVVEHFAQHTGQIILLTKLMTGDDLGYYRHLRGSSQAAKSAHLP